MTDRDFATVGCGLHSETNEPWTLRLHDGALNAAPGCPGFEEAWVEDELAALAPSELAGTWRHYKGGRYTVHAEARAPDGATLVVYTSADGRVWLRPAAMWQEIVASGAYA